MKKIKMILPALAILFAVAAVLATNANPKSLTKVEISIRDGACEPDGFCTEQGTEVCTYQNDDQTFLDTYTPGVPSPTCATYSNEGVWSSN